MVWVFRQPHGSEGPLCQKPRPRCARAMGFLAYDPPPDGRKALLCRETRIACTHGTPFLAQDGPLGIRPFALRDTTTTTGSWWAKNGTGDPPSGQAGPWIPFSGFFPAERPLRGFGTSAIVPLAANSRCVHFRLASAAAATRRHRVAAAGPPSSLQPWRRTPEVSAHIGKRQPSEPGGGFDWQKLPARVLTRAICCHGLRNDV